jgi:hypothetical protein
MREVEQLTLHSSGVPKIWLMVQAFPSSQLVGQFPSHNSPASTVPFPHTEPALQSESESALQPAGQHPSPPLQVVIAVLEHVREQVAAAPVPVFTVHAFVSSQLVGQLPSQVSGTSTIPLPQVLTQSPSVVESQPSGQHPSPFAHATGSIMQRAVQALGEPSSEADAQDGAAHESGQAPGPEAIAESQASPRSTTPLPQSWLVLLLVGAGPPFVFAVSPHPKASTRRAIAKNKRIYRLEVSRTNIK